VGISQLPFRIIRDRLSLRRRESANGISRRAVDSAKRFLSWACGDCEPLRARNAHGCAGERCENGPTRFPHEESLRCAHACGAGGGGEILWLAAQENARGA